MYKLDNTTKKALRLLPISRIIQSGLPSHWHLEFRKFNFGNSTVSWGILCCYPMARSFNIPVNGGLCTDPIDFQTGCLCLLHVFISETLYSKTMFNPSIPERTYHPPHIPELLTVSDIRLMHYLQQTLYPIISGFKIRYRRNDALIDGLSASLFVFFEDPVREMMGGRVNRDCISKKSGRTDRDKETMAIPERIICCNACNVASHNMKWCRACRIVRYCNKKCQKTDWNKGNHREICKRNRKEKWYINRRMLL